MEYIFKKVLIVGDANCGKTSLASAFIQSAPLDEEDEDPLGAVSKVVPVDVDGTEISLVLTNISGLNAEKFIEDLKILSLFYNFRSGR